MNYKNIYNPLDVDVKTGYKGEYFTIPSKKSESFPEDLVAWFKEMYPFLELKESEVKKEVKVEKKEDKVKVEKKVVVKDKK